jgi:predicted nucleic acid-binding Zn ribbon protein
LRVLLKTVKETFHIPVIAAASMLSADVVCGKCGSIIYQMRMLKSVKDALRATNSHCPVCGAALNPGDFAIAVNKR